MISRQAAETFVASDPTIAGKIQRPLVKLEAALHAGESTEAAIQRLDREMTEALRLQKILKARIDAHSQREISTPQMQAAQDAYAALNDVLVQIAAEKVRVTTESRAAITSAVAGERPAE